MMPEDRFIIGVTDDKGKQNVLSYSGEDRLLADWGSLHDNYNDVAVFKEVPIDKDGNGLDTDTKYKVIANYNGTPVTYSMSGRSINGGNREWLDATFGKDGWYIQPEYRPMSPRMNGEGAVEGFDEWTGPKTNRELWDETDSGREFRELDARMNTPEYQTVAGRTPMDDWQPSMRGLGDPDVKKSVSDIAEEKERTAGISEDIRRYNELKSERGKTARIDALLERARDDDSSLQPILDRISEIDREIDGWKAEIAGTTADLDFSPDAYKVTQARMEIERLKQEREALQKEGESNSAYQARLELQQMGLEDAEQTRLDAGKYFNVHETTRHIGGAPGLDMGSVENLVNNLNYTYKNGKPEGWSDNPNAAQANLGFVSRFNTDTRLTLDAVNNSFWAGTGTVLKDPSTWGMSLFKGVDQIGVRMIIDKMMKDPDSLTKDEEMVIEAWQRNTEAHMLQDPMRSSAFKGGQGFAQSIEFMIEMAITGGIVDAANEGALRLALNKWGRKGATRWIEGQVAKGAVRTFNEGFTKYAVGKVEGTIAKYAAEQGVNFAMAIPRGALQTALNFPMEMRLFGESLLAFDEEGNLPTWGKALGSASWQNFIETYTENGIEPLWNVLTKVPVKWAGTAMRSFLPGAFTDLEAMYTKARVSGFWRMMRAGGFQGINEEVAEELAGALLNAATGNPEELHDFFTKDNLETLYISFAPMGLLGGGVSMAQVGMAERNYRRQRAGFENLLGDMGFDPHQTALALDGILSNPVNGHLGLLDSIYAQAMAEGAIVEGEDANGKKTLEFTGRWKELTDKMGEYRAAAAEKAIYDGAWASEQNAQRRDDYRSLYGDVGGDFSFTGRYGQERTRMTDGGKELTTVEDGERMGKEMGTEEKKEGRMTDSEAQRHIDNDNVAVIRTKDGRQWYVMGRAENGEWAVKSVKGGEMLFIGDDQIERGEKRDKDGKAVEMTAEETVKAATMTMREFIDQRLLFGENQRKRVKAAQEKEGVRAARGVLIRGMMDELFPEQHGGKTFGPNGEYRVADSQPFTNKGLMVYKPGWETARMMKWEQIGRMLHGDNFRMPTEEDVDRRMAAEEKTERGEEPSALDRIPRDENGRPVFEQAESPAVAWDAMVERAQQSGGDANMAGNMAKGALETARRESRKAERDAEKAEARARQMQNNPKGDTFEEMMQNQERTNAEAKEARAKADEAKRKEDFWQGVVDEIGSRAEVEEIRKRRETRQQEQTAQRPRRTEEATRKANATVEEMTGMTYDKIAEIYGEDIANFVRDLAEQARKWGLPCRILMTEDDLKEFCKREGIKVPNGRVNGFAHNGVAYIHLAGLLEESTERAATERKGVMTLAHEGMAHIGMDAMMGSERYGKYCERVFGNMSKVGARRWLRYQWRYNMGDKSKRDALGITDGNAKIPAWEELTDEQVGMLMSGSVSENMTRSQAEAIGKARRGAADEYIASVAEKVFSGGRLSVDERGVWEKVRDWFLRVFGGVLTERDIADRLRRVERMAERGKLFGERNGETKNEGTSFFAEEKDNRLPMEEFTKSNGMTEESVNLMRDMGLITRKEANRADRGKGQTWEYGWSGRDGRDWAWEYGMHKEEIDALAREYAELTEAGGRDGEMSKADYFRDKIDFNNQEEFDKFEELERAYNDDIGRNESEEDRRRREEEYVSELEKAFPQLSESDEYKKHSAEVDRYNEKRAEEQNRMKELTDRAREVLNEEIKPIGESAFGPIYNQFKGKPKEAVTFLVKNRNGDLLGVFHRDDIGDIDLVWGDDTRGFCHIINKHIGINEDGTRRDFATIEEATQIIDYVLKNGRIIQESGRTYVVSDNGYRVAIRKDLDGNKKNWIVSAIDYNRSEEEKGIAANPTPASHDAKGPELAASRNSENKGSEKSDTSKENAENSLFSAEERAERAGRVLSEVQGQKRPGTAYDTADIDMDDLGDTRFSVGERRRTEMENRLRKVRPDMTEEQRDALFDYLGTLTKPNGDNDTKLQNATFNWFAKGAIRIPEDMDKVRQAVKVAEMAKVDPMRYDSPMELIDENSEFKVKDKPINPDEVPVLRKVKEYPNGITVYEFDDLTETDDPDFERTDEDQRKIDEVRGWLRRIINTHWGEDCNPWCLLAADDDGNLTDDSMRMWNKYSRYGKRVAFKDGKLLAFFAAGQNDEPTWWDRQDRPHRGIPITRKMDDGSGRTATYEYVENMGDFYDSDSDYYIEEGADDWEMWHPMNEWRDNWKEGIQNPTDIHKGNKQNGTYEEWHNNGQLKKREHYKDGQLNGVRETWFNNGQLASRSNYVNGNNDGLFEEWYSDGEVNTRGYYKDGRREGYWEIYYKGGIPEECGNYKDGKKNGVFEEGGIGGNGNIYRTNYVDGIKDGLYEWYENDVLRVRGEYKDGHKSGVWDEFSRNGQLRAQTPYKNDTINGAYIVWDDDGQIAKYTEYRNGRRDGLDILFAKNRGSGYTDYAERYIDGRFDGVIPDEEVPSLIAERGIDINGETKFSAEERENMTPKQIDDEYFRAMEAGDEATMREMLDEVARRNGYGKDNDWRSYHTAPSRGETAEDGTLYTWTLRDVADGGQVANDISDSYPASADINGSRDESMGAIQDALSAIRRGEDPTVTIYRAVPKGVEEGKVRNGDWVSMSRAYAEEHGRSNIDGDYRIIEEKVPASQLYWDGNDINEWGFDDQQDYRYRNTKNNRKLDDLVTRDDDGNVIPPSKRFDNRNADTRFSAEEREIIDKARDEGKLGLAPNGKQSNLFSKYGEHVWAMVRTPQFKNWFGDWEKPSRIKKLRDPKQATVTLNWEEHKDKYALTTAGARNYVTKHLRYRKFKNKDTGENIKIIGNTGRKITSHDRASEAHLKSVVAIPDLIKNAIFIEELPNTKKGTKKREWLDYDSYRYYVCGINIDGVDYTAKVVVGVKEGRRYYDHSLTQIEKGKLLDQIDQGAYSEGFKSSPDMELVSSPELNFDSSSLSGGEDRRLISILQNNSSKVVDENGEPLVVYHGSRTGGEFNTFNGETFFIDNKDVADMFRDDASYFVSVNGKGRNTQFGLYVRAIVGDLFRGDYEADELLGNGTMDIKEQWDSLTDYEKENIRDWLGMDEDEDLETLRVEAAQPTFETFLNIRNPYIIDFNDQNWQADESRPEASFEKAREEGHDGMIIRNIVEGGPVAELLNGDEVPPATDYVTFSPNQIKSVDNNGDFSTENNDIHFSAEERELSDSDTRETVSDIENPENDDRFSAEERVATADEARERLGVELTPDDLASTSTKHGAMMKALRIATENGAIPNMDSSAETAFFSDTFRNAPEEVRNAIQETAFNGDYDIAGETERTLAGLVTDEVMGRELTDAQREFLDGTARTLAERLGISEDNAKYVLWQHVNADNETTTDAERLAMQNALGVTTPASDYEAGVQSEVRYSMAEEYMGDSAADYYEKSLESIAGALDEVYHNEYRALDEMVKAVVKASGKKMEGWENPMYAYNQLTSRTKAALDRYMRDYFDPLRDTIADICKRYDLNVNDLIEYVSLKHGLERNEVFHRREWERLQEEENRKAEKEGREPKQIPEPERRDYSGIMEWMKGHKEKGEFDNIADAERAAQMIVDDYEYAMGYRIRIDEEGKERINPGCVWKLWDAINDATRESLDVQLNSGLISRELYDQITGMFQYYIPLQGFSKDTKTNEDKYYYIDTWQEGHAGTIGKRAKGRKTKADNPFTRIGLNAQKAIVEAQKNRAKTVLYQFLAERPNDLTATGEVWYVRTNEVDDKGKEIWQVAAPTFNENDSPERMAETMDRWRKRMRELADKGEAVREADRFTLGDNVRFIFPKDVPQHCIDVAIDGRRERIYIKGNPRAAQAVNGLLSKRDGKLAKAVNAATRYCASIYTSLNPQFFVTNFCRDVGYAMSNETGKEGFGYAARLAGNAVLAAQIGVLSHKYRHGELDTDRRMQGYYEEFAMNGGITGYSQMQNDKYYTKYVERAMKGGKWMRAALNAPLRAFRQVTEDGENLLRFAAYVTSRQMGRGIEESIANAKDATVNFNRRGTGRMITMEEAERLIPNNKVGQVMLCASSLLGACRPLWAFFNVAVQGMAQMVQNLVRHPLRTGLTTIVPYFGLGLMNGLIHGAAKAMFGGDPPEADDWYWNLSDYERRNNIIIPLGNGNYIKIPMAQELRVFYGMGDIVAGTLAHKTKQKNILKEMLGSIGDMLPVNTFGEGGAAQSLMPTFIAPVTDIALNTDYRGMRIIPETYGGKKARWRYAYSGTPDWAVNASRAINGWNNGTSGAIDVPPEAIQHLAEGWLGGIMTFVSMCCETGESVVKGEDVNMRRVPFVNRFYGRTKDHQTGAYLAEMNRYAKDIYETARVKLDDFHDEKDTAGRREYRKTKEYAIYDAYRKYGTKAADLAKEIADTENERRRMEKIERRNDALFELATEMEKILYGGEGGGIELNYTEY